MKMITRLLKSFLINWKFFFLDAERLILFISLLILFPSPFYYIVVAGFAPIIYSISLGLSPYYIPIGSVSFYLLALIIICINVLINSYLLQFVVVVIAKLLKSLINKSIIRKLILSLSVTLLILFASKFNIYGVGNAGGGLHNFNLTTAYKSAFTNYNSTIKNIRGFNIH